MAAMARKIRCRSHILIFLVTTGICCASGGNPCWWRGDTENAGILAGVQRLRGGGWFVPITQLPTRVIGSVVDKVKHGREAAREKEVQDACRNLDDQKCAAALRGMAAKGYNLRYITRQSMDPWACNARVYFFLFMQSHRLYE
jgi:hypothetical protein